MRQFDMFQESGRLNVIGVGQHEFLVLRRGAKVVFAQFFPSQGAIDQRHGNRLALGLAEHQSVTAGELRRFGFRSGELVHGFAFGQGDFTDIHGETQFRNFHFNRAGSNAKLTHKRMVAPVSALGGIGHAQHEPLVTPRQRLQAQRTGCGVFHRLAGHIGRHRIAGGFGLDQPVAVQEFGDARHRGLIGFALRRIRHQPFGGQCEIQQAVGVIKGRSQHLPARRILEGGRHPAIAGHFAGIHRC